MMNWSCLQNNVNNHKLMTFWKEIWLIFETPDGSECRQIVRHTNTAKGENGIEGNTPRCRQENVCLQV